MGIAMESIRCLSVSHLEAEEPATYADSKQDVLRKIIEMTEIGFDDDKYKRKCMKAIERQALLQWDVLLMLIHDKDEEI